MESIIHPYFISDSYIFSSFIEMGMDNGHAGDLNDTPGQKHVLRTDPNQKNAGKVPPMTMASKTMKFVASNDMSARKESNPLNASFCLPKLGKDEKRFIDYFTSCVCKSIEQVSSYLDSTDKLYNFNTLKEAFHKRGLNMRFEWIVFAKIRRRDMKDRLGVDILVRTIKRMLNAITSKKLKQIRSSNTMLVLEPSLKRDKIDETSDFFAENFSKRYLAHYMSLLMKGTSEVTIYIPLVLTYPFFID